MRCLAPFSYDVVGMFSRRGGGARRDTGLRGVEKSIWGDLLSESRCLEPRKHKCPLMTIGVQHLDFLLLFELLSDYELLTD